MNTPERLEEFKGCLLYKKLKEAGFTEAQLELFFKVSKTVCQNCWDAEPPCFCWNDE